MSEWRYILSRLNGDGTETFLDYEIPLSGAAVQESLSGHGGIDGNITPEVARLKGEDGEPLFVPWWTAIYAEADGHIRGGGLITQVPLDGPSLSIDSIGHTGYLTNQPWIGDNKFDTADPLAIDRFIWETFQKEPFDLGMKLTGAKESQMVRLSETVSGAEDFFYLGYWETIDLDKTRTDLAEIGGYEWVVSHHWDGEQIVHEIEYGYPRIGTRRHDLSFVVGENIPVDIKATSSGDEYASHVLVLGAGQGRKTVRAEATSSPKRLARWEVVSDKSIGKDSIAKSRAETVLKAKSGGLDVTDVEVIDHDNARVGSYRAGDEILIQSGPGWADFGDIWVRILDIIHHPETNRSTLQVRRGEKIS